GVVLRAGVVDALEIAPARRRVRHAPGLRGLVGVAVRVADHEHARGAPVVTLALDRAAAPGGGPTAVDADPPGRTALADDGGPRRTGGFPGRTGASPHPQRRRRARPVGDDS